MATIKDIYQWIKFPPEPPSNLSPLQKIEWNERNSQLINDFKNKSFVGELLLSVPAIIYGIEKNKINASTYYIQIRMDDYWQVVLRDNPYQNYELIVFYEIFYDESFYETIRLIHNGSMIEFEGTIISFSQKRPENYEGSPVDVYLNVKLKLSNIKVIQNEKLYSNLLNDNHYFVSRKKSNCFIATAAFGNQDIIEVVTLKEFRDKILMNSIGGRLFITAYNLISPPIAFIIRQNNWLRKLTRIFLRKVVLPITKQITIQYETNKNIA